MNTTIRFPHLGLTFNPGKSFTVFGIEIAYYGVIIALAMLMGALVAYREAKKTGQKVDDYVDFTLYTLIAAIIGARIYYVIFNYSVFKGDFLSIFKIWEGGLAIYGAEISSIIFIIYYCKKKNKDIYLTLDTIVPYLILGQAMGRWGNFINKEAHGAITTYEHLKELHIPEW